MIYPSQQINLIHNLVSEGSFAHIDAAVDKVAAFMLSGYLSNKPSVVFGNGGSASDASHFAAELICSFDKVNRPAFPLISLSSDPSILTAWSNDFDFTGIFSRQISSFGPNLSCAIGLSTSGTSLNVVNGLREAHKLGAKSILLTGSMAPSYDFLDLNVRFPTDSTPLIQTLTQLFYHSVSSSLEATLSTANY